MKLCLFVSGSPQIMWLLTESQQNLKQRNPCPGVRCGEWWAGQCHQRVRGTEKIVWGGREGVKEKNFSRAVKDVGYSSLSA